MTLESGFLIDGEARSSVFSEYPPVDFDLKTEASGLAYV